MHSPALAAGLPRVLLYVVNDPGVFLSHRLVFARAARDHGWAVHVATPVGPDVVHVAAEGFTHHPISLSRRGMKPSEELRTLWDLIRLFRRLRPTVVDCATIKPVLYGGVAAWTTGVAGLVQAITGLGHVFADTGPGSSLRRGLVRAAYVAAFHHPNSRVVCQHAEDRDRLGFALRPGQAALIPGSGVDPARFHDEPEPDGPLLVLLAGRMLWTKGVADFVAAAGLLRARGVDARFVLVGDPDPGNPASIPESTLLGWSAGGDVEWWGRRRDMPAIMRSVSVVCLPTFYGEGVPKVLVEAAASGRPIVATDWPGCRDIVRHGWNGTLVPPRDVAALADALGAMLADRDLRSQMGARGRHLALSRFTEAHVVDSVLRVYDELVPGGSAVALHGQTA